MAARVTGWFDDAVAHFYTQIVRLRAAVAR